MAKIRLYNIDWDTDGEKVDDLPEEVIIPAGYFFSDNELDPGTVYNTDFSDYLSDNYGFCVNGYFIDVVQSTTRG